MNNHIPTLSNMIYTCNQCTFRAIQTTRGPYVLNNGAGRDLHLSAIVAQQAEQREWIARRLARLRGVNDTALRQRLERCVVGEFEVW